MKQRNENVTVYGDGAFNQGEFTKTVYVNPASGAGTHLEELINRKLLAQITEADVQYLKDTFLPAFKNLATKLDSNEDLNAQILDMEQEFKEDCPKKSRISASYEYLRNKVPSIDKMSKSATLLEKVGKGIQIIISAL